METDMFRFHFFATLLLILTNITEPSAAQEISLTFVGDIMGHSPQINSAQSADGSNYNYHDCFRYIESYLREADLTTGNLEVTLAGAPYTGYPTFSSPDPLAYALQDAGVDLLVTANNHSCDRRQAGIERTVSVLDNNYILRTGTFRDSLDMRENNPLLIAIKGIRLAILNYTYGTNGIPVSSPNIVNLIQRELITRHLAAAQTFKPDKIIVVIHWGVEYQTNPGRDQIDLASYLFNQGVDIIIGSHPHVIQPMHWYRNENKPDKLVVYSLGNFISNQRKPLTDGGAMVKLMLTKKDTLTEITGAEYLLTWVHTPLVNGKKRYYVLPASQYHHQGLPSGLPQGHQGMYDYLKLARKVMENNTNINETKGPNINPTKLVAAPQSR